MTPRDDESSEKRRRILEAALEVCRKRGVGGARMEEVAALAQVSKGTLYRFFASKEDLFLAMMIAAYEGHRSTVELLLNAGANPNARTLRSSSALELASVQGHTEIVRLLGDRKRDVALTRERESNE